MVALSLPAVLTASCFGAGETPLAGRKHGRCQTRTIALAAQLRKAVTVLRTCGIARTGRTD
jgi:hypothetical protein